MRIVGGSHRNRKLVAPKGIITRPTSERLREALFNICQGYIEGAHFLDLFAGSGAMGLEAVSRGAASATFIDADKSSIQCVKQNVQNLSMEDRAQVFCGDVFSSLEKLMKQGKQYGIIYADPPYATHAATDPVSARLLKMIDKSTLLMPQGDLFIEESSSVKVLSDELINLKHVSSRQYGHAALHQYRFFSTRTSSE